MIRIGSKYNAFGSTALLKSLDDKSLQQAPIQHCSMCMLLQSTLLEQRANCKKLNSEFITRTHSVTRNQYTVLGTTSVQENRALTFFDSFVTANTRGGDTRNSAPLWARGQDA